VLRFPSRYSEIDPSPLTFSANRWALSLSASLHSRSPHDSLLNDIHYDVNCFPGGNPGNVCRTAIPNRSATFAVKVVSHRFIFLAGDFPPRSVCPEQPELLSTFKTVFSMIGTFSLRCQSMLHLETMTSTRYGGLCEFCEGATLAVRSRIVGIQNWREFLPRLRNCEDPLSQQCNVRHIAVFAQRSVGGNNPRWRTTSATTISRRRTALRTDHRSVSRRRRGSHAMPAPGDG
jgi:hypothetical protein